MPEQSTSKERVRAAFWMGLAFALTISAIYVAPTDTTTIAGVLIAAHSPIYLWRFSHCSALNVYQDPTWLIHLEAIVPFFVYGAVIGYFLKLPPRLSVKYIATTIISLFAVLIVLFYLPVQEEQDPNCKSSESERIGKGMVATGAASVGQPEPY